MMSGYLSAGRMCQREAHDHESVPVWRSWPMDQIRAYGLALGSYAYDADFAAFHLVIVTYEQTILHFQVS